MLQNQTDETLVMLTLAGEQDAYEVLVRRYQRAVVSAAASVTHNPFMAEDAAQDAFVTAWMKLDTLQEPQKFAAWVCRIAKNCALNQLRRFHSYLPLDVVDNLPLADDRNCDPAEAFVSSEERAELRQTVGRLPEKVQRIIRLHYFDGFSVAEIADRLRISVGTVKWQLHDGRKRIRKELCAMNEKCGDTLVQRVMKKVEELKLWQMKNSKNGFAAVYADVLREVESLPESDVRYHALADVLMRGWWWLPGEKNDALFARVKEAAVLGRNDEVMAFIVAREDEQLPDGADKIDFIRNKQIPMLEKAGFVQTLAREWFWLGRECFRQEQPDKGAEAWDRALGLLRPSDVYHALIPRALEFEERRVAFLGKEKKRYFLTADAAELRFIDGALCYWKDERISDGWLASTDWQIGRIFRNSSRCDGRFFDESLAVGETRVGSDGATLTFASDRETVETPCGTFTDCRLWLTRYADFQGCSLYKSYYKEGVGIVRHEHIQDGFTAVRLLKAYHIAGGEGLLPLAAGNVWEYASGDAPDVLHMELKFSVAYAGADGAVFTSFEALERLRYDENSWQDMIEAIRNEYCRKLENGESVICDVSHVAERAETLAETSLQKAHTKAACAVARRIMATDPEFNPEYTARGHWNFFQKFGILQNGGAVSLTLHPRWSFEWKGGWDSAGTPILFNDVYGILQDAAGCIWSEEWRAGAAPLVEYMMWGTVPVKTRINCADGGSIATKAGTFDRCLVLTLDISGLKDGLSYRGGRKKYYFAEGVGIVRTENEYCDGLKTAVYELTAYQGTGEGYMPFADGLLRRYEAVGLTDGYVGAAEYTYCAEENGQITIFADRTGVRETLAPVTSYASIQDEVLEEALCEKGRHAEGRLRHDVNNFRLMVHFLTRPTRYWGMPEKAAAWNRYRMQLMESFGENGQSPAGWLGLYAATCFRTACALFGCGRKEEGYICLERAFELFRQWADIPDGTEMEAGKAFVFGGVRLVKGKGVLLLPDGSREPFEECSLYGTRIDLPYYGMTAPSGWEWFDSVRGEERFRAFIERAKALAVNGK